MSDDARAALAPSAPVAFRPDDDDGPVAFPDVPPTPSKEESGHDTEHAEPAQAKAAAAPAPTTTTTTAATTAAAAAAADDDIIPTAIVIKNIPFAMKREQLIAIIDQLRLPQPYALNYHFEGGAFRGLAFANFRVAADADAVVQGLHGHTVLGRDIRVEYKKVLPAEEAARKEAQRRASILALDDRVPEFDLSDPATRALYEKMVHFRDDPTRFELIFAKSITGPERKLVRAIGQRLGFFYRTEDNGEERFFKVTRQPSSLVATAPPLALVPSSVALALKDKAGAPRKYSFAGTSAAVGSNGLSSVMPTLGTGIPAGLAIPDHRVPAAVATLRAAEAGAARIRAYSMGNHASSLAAPSAARPAFRKNSMLSAAPPPGLVSAATTTPASSAAAAAAAAAAAPGGALRQPKGPEGLTGSTLAGGASRKNSQSPAPPPFNVREVQAAVAAAGAQKKAVDIVDPASKATVESAPDSENSAADVDAAATAATAAEKPENASQ